MAHYLLRWQFKNTTAKNLIEHPQGRTKQANILVEDFGGKLLSYYFALGDYDGIAIAEFPDNIAATACSMTAASTGSLARFETTVLLTAKEAEAAMKMAQETKTKYKPANA